MKNISGQTPSRSEPVTLPISSIVLPLTYEQKCKAIRDQHEAIQRLGLLKRKN